MASPVGSDDRRSFYPDRVGEPGTSAGLKDDPSSLIGREAKAVAGLGSCGWVGCWREKEVVVAAAIVVVAITVATIEV